MSEPWTGAEHEPRNPDEWWVGCVCGNNHTVTWFRSQWAGRAVHRLLSFIERLEFHDPDGSGFCPRCHFPIAVHPLDEDGVDVGRCPDQSRAAPPLHDPQEPERG